MTLAMQFRTFILTLFLPSICSAILIEPPKPLELDVLHNAHPKLLVAFTSSDASLQSFNSTFAEAASASTLPFLAIDCEENAEACKEQDVNEYPAVRLYKWEDREEETERDGGEQEDGSEQNNNEVKVEVAKTEFEVVRYRGRKTVRALRSFAVRHEVPHLSKLGSDADELEAFKKIDDIVVIAYVSNLDENENKILIDTFRAVAEKRYTDFVFGYVSSLEVAEKEGISTPSIKVYKNTDGDNDTCQGVWDQSVVEQLLERVSKDVIGEFTERNQDEYLQPNKLTVYIFASDEESGLSVRRELTQLAKKYEQYVKMGVADAYEYAPMAGNFGLKLEGGSLPVLAVHAPMNDHVFSYDQRKKIEKREVEAMLVTILQGKAQNGQVFGEGADDADRVGDEAQTERSHDEL